MLIENFLVYSVQVEAKETAVAKKKEDDSFLERLEQVQLAEE